MNEFFLWDELSCWICGDQTKLTAEHKFKAADLKASFGKDRMWAVLGHDPNAESYVRELQSPNSKFAQFPASICAQCNNARTQRHDQAYDRLSARLRELMLEGSEPFEIANEEPWCDGHNPITASTFRYFCKHLGCLATASKMPIPSSLPPFILETTNCFQILPKVFTNRELRNWILGERSQGENCSRVGHSGLSILFDEKVVTPKAYGFGIEIDWAKVEVRYEFSEREIASICTHFPDQVQRARDNALSKNS